MAQSTLRAVYHSPDSDSFKAVSALSTAETKADHLASLRAAVTAVQADVNRELTARMVVDATRSAKDAAAAQKEEASYGEEMVE
ncbi:hypothetical protein CMQ_6854 [Grosmannia clavigera kw1407]|uniref:EKC/KEOPS complex subunit GON7 n=1 Tax=Grosmannia clavigera (strain kw1407 / UAMH 11150) TaxID=655863 RepID=F0X7Z9_GROCL|nr:uncharacterized protein CMQ_6854 [Grosmannia clavigera kw1407]EFX06533.1 hypothetical protein CMQ_6854 [Grosmannia clavigera kw1407]